ncbi:Secoisolariciresinol dehydrogenase [Capsicum annuum]|uniref:Secoisolariciresinol dehydrogenase n=1 Tax=Capsicum annuum TaxID=4072 RepID=A0A1U8EGW4_CAPAN|nr:short chain aldehyde dehydrogenase 1 [Capsicum annuum]KAF3661775.1 Secoisolariciresinol dehydrogenase [Capsicum annuum]PHT95531.1 Secoisolariciresinol dehydrogenase [Capsicum annuum]
MASISSIAKRLEGKVAIITGGASGIGEATTRLFIEHGAKVVIADVQDDLGQSIVKEIGENSDVCYVHCDVSVEKDVENAVNVAVSRYGKLDIMFSNAGVSEELDSTILKSDYENFKKVFDVNVFGALMCSKHAARVMIPAKKGVIIFTSSVASVTCGGTVHTYLASKHAIVGLAKNLGVELGQHGIRVNCVSPFGVPTPMLMKGLGINEKKKVEEFVCQIANLKGTISHVEDVAQTTLYLASDESKYISGMNIIIDGGFSTTNVALKQGIETLRY